MIISLFQHAKYLQKAVTELNSQVAAVREYCMDKMGTTMAVVYYTSGYVYRCNVGDSRTYCLRDDVFQRLSKDHTTTFSGMEDGILSQ